MNARGDHPGTEVLDRLRTRQAHSGRLGTEDVEAVAAELRLPRAHVHGAASFFADLGYAEPPQARVCAGAACFAATAGAFDAPAAGAQPVQCLGYCYAAPARLDGEVPHAGADQIDPPVPFEVRAPEAVVLGRLCGTGPEPWSVWPLVRNPEGRARVLDAVARSQIRGRGGAGFPAAVKWTTAAESGDGGTRYIVANGDEGDPGSFVDRLLMERDPHGVLEGMALAALAVGADRGWVYVRSEYPRAREALRAAIGEARAAGHLGAGFDVEVFEGAGSYVAGEETALIRSMEGRRGGATPRPPFPAVRGLHGRPTVVNNVETLAAIPWIVASGGEAYAQLGRGASRGTKVVCLNERFARPGAYEVELGTSVRSIVEELGGGLRDGRSLRALQVGGPLGGFLGPGELDVPLAFEDLVAVGVDLGHGSLVAFDDRVDPAALLLHVWHFIAGESCGTCAPCRIGSRRGLALAERIAARRATADDLAALDALLDTLAAGSLCGFGQGAPQPVRSLLRLFPELREAA